MPAVRQAQPAAAHGPVPRGLAPGGRTRHHPRRPTEDQRWLVESAPRSRPSATRPTQAGEDTADLDEVIAGSTRRSRRRACAATSLGRTAPQALPLDPAAPGRPGPAQRKVEPDTTLGQTFTAPDGKIYRPSLFVTLTLPSYGRVRRRRPRSTRPPTTTRGRLGTRCTSPSWSTGSCRTCAGSSATTCSTSPPSNPRSGSPRTCTSPSAAPSPAPSCGRSSPPPTTRCGGPRPTRSASTATTCPVWARTAGRRYLDPATGELLPTWDEALDALDADEDAEPLHVVRFGDQFDVQGVLAGSPDADRCIGYLTKYLTKSLGDALDPTTDAQRDHAARLAEALRYEPCSPTCANWLRYGIQPKGARPGMLPGRCKGKAHKPEHLGYAGRRVLVSRKWSGKTLADHKQDRRTWVLEVLGQADEPAPTRTATSGGPSRPVTPTSPRSAYGSCARSPNGSAGAAHLDRAPSQSRRTRSFGNRRGGGVTSETS